MHQPLVRGVAAAVLTGFVVAPILYAQRLDGVGPAASVAPDIPGVVKGGTPVELLRTGMDGSEGPVAAPDGSLLFTTGSTITRLDAAGNFTTYLDGTSGVTGLGFDRSGRLLAARTDPAQVLVLLPDRTVLADSVNGQPLLRPNDLAIDRHGGVYFSDQPRRPDQPQVPARRKGILYMRPDGRVIEAAIGRIEQPNGVVLSPDEDVLYAADSRGASIIAFDVETPGSLTNARAFGQLEGGLLETASGVLRSADGMAVDSDGRLYIATRLGVEVLSSEGRHLGTIRIAGGTGPQNVAFAGPDKKTLFVVGARAIWRIRMEAQGFTGRAK